MRGQLDARSLAQRIRTIELNMERWRWIPDSLLGDRYVMVNIPEFMLRVIEHDRPVLTMRVVVGKEGSRTPMFTDEITYMVLNPTWNVPASIAVDEIVPEIQKDASYLERNNMRVFSNETDKAVEVDPSDIDWSAVSTGNFRYAIRQDPGPENPVGNVKLMCPNQFNVYLHDTPSDQLFSAGARGFSHGCIRLEKPVDFAVYLMKSKGWSHETVTAAFDSANNTSVKVPEALPVRIFYWTAFIGDGGQLQFRDDVYGFDQLIDRVLRQQRPDIKQPVRTALMNRAPNSETAQNPLLRTRPARKRAA
jgi:murein L,D-transpeptidase YcbB/YkuD